MGEKAVAVELRSVVKRYGATTAVNNVSLTVEAGTLATLLGPSGCGKTTTLRLIAGLESVTEGRVLIGGRDMTRLPASERKAGPESGPDSRMIAMAARPAAVAGA